MSRTHRMHGVPMAEARAKNRHPQSVYLDLTPLERRAISALQPGRVSYPVGSFFKRFARELQTAEQVTDKQRRCLWRMAWTFRRQVTDGEVTEHAESVREWANERAASPASATSEPIPVSACEPTSEDVASLPGLFDEVRS